jgi:SAM-dependent methyltransferase
MELFRASLRLPGITDVRAAVLDDLSTYSGLSVEECVERCRNWESWSVKEWSAADRSSKDGMTDFYRTTESWAFDLLWFAYLQAEGYGLPTSVLALQAIGARDHGPAHLDFGSGAGVTSQVFARAGYDTALADISTSLLDFARFRLSRRGQEARFIDLNDERLGTGRYDVITALDTLILIPDLPDVVAGLHRALRPGGWLITNFDVRPPVARERLAPLRRRPEPSGDPASRGVRAVRPLRGPVQQLRRVPGVPPRGPGGRRPAAPGAVRPARPHQPSPPRHPPPEPAPGRRDPAEDRVAGR